MVPWQCVLVSLWYHWTLPLNGLPSLPNPVHLRPGLEEIKGPNNCKIHQKHCKWCCILRVCIDPQRHFGFECFHPSWWQSCSAPEMAPAGVRWKAGWQVQWWQPQKQQQAAGLLASAHTQLLRADSIWLSVGYGTPSSILKERSAAQFSMKKACCTWVFVCHSSSMRHPDSWSMPADPEVIQNTWLLLKQHKPSCTDLMAFRLQMDITYMANH